jgi:hypothetical protein
MTHHQLIRTSPAEANIALLIDADNAPVYGFGSSNTFPGLFSIIVASLIHEETHSAYRLASLM